MTPVRRRGSVDHLEARACGRTVAAAGERAADEDDDPVIAGDDRVVVSPGLITCAGAA